MTRTKCKLQPVESKSNPKFKIYNNSLIFSLRIDGRGRSLEVHASEYTTSIALQRPGSISWISARVRTEQPRVHFDDHPRQSEMVRKAAI